MRLSGAAITSALVAFQLSNTFGFSPSSVIHQQRLLSGPLPSGLFSSKSSDETVTATATATIEDEPSIGSIDVNIDSAATETNDTENKRDFGSDFLDEEKLYAESTFPIKADDLIIRAKEVLSADCRIGQKDNAECLADDFKFRAQVIGPLGKEDYVGALASFNLEECFDTKPNYFGFSVDPMQTNRVWFFCRVEAKHVGTFMGAEPTGKEIVYPPQTFHLDFNDNGKVIEFGFYTVDRNQGNTGGLGGAFGFMYGVGKPLPIPECQPYKRSKRFRLLVAIGELGKRLKRNKETSGKKN